MFWVIARFVTNNLAQLGEEKWIDDSQNEIISMVLFSETFYSSDKHYHSFNYNFRPNGLNNNKLNSIFTVLWENTNLRRNLRFNNNSKKKRVSSNNRERKSRSLRQAIKRAIKQRREWKIINLSSGSGWSSVSRVNV